MILVFYFVFVFFAGEETQRGGQANERQRLNVKPALKSAVLFPTPAGFLVNGPHCLVSSHW